MQGYRPRQWTRGSTREASCCWRWLLGISGNSQLVVVSTHRGTTEEPRCCFVINTKTCVHLYTRASPWWRSPTLSPPRFLLHQCTLMKGNAPTTNPIMLHTKITTCCTVTKEKSKQPRNEAQVVVVVFCLFSFFPELFNQRWKERRRKRK